MYRVTEAWVYHTDYLPWSRSVLVRQLRVNRSQKLEPTPRKVLIRPLPFGGSMTSAHLHCLGAATEPMVKTPLRAAFLQRPAQQRLQHELTFTPEPYSDDIYMVPPKKHRGALTTLSHLFQQ